MTNIATFARRALVIFGGATLLIGGIALLVLPGPGLLLILASLLLLGTEFDWAKRWSVILKYKIKNKTLRGNPEPNTLPTDHSGHSHS